jgi:hypothetical protein
VSFPLLPPGAGVDYPTQTVPGGVVWIPQTITGLFTASAVAGSRAPVIRIDDGTTRYASIGATNSTGAGAATTYTFAATQGAAATTAATGLTMPFPVLVLPPGHRINPATVSLDVGDTWTALAISVFEFSVEQIAQQLAEMDVDNVSFTTTGGLG